MGCVGCLSQAGRDHRRQPLHQVAKRPVGLAARAHDHPCPEVGQGRAVLGQDLRASRGGCADAPTPGGRRDRRGRRRALTPSRAAICAKFCAPRRSRSSKSPRRAPAHGVNEVVGDLGALPGLAQGLGIAARRPRAARSRAERAGPPSSGPAPGSGPPIPDRRGRRRGARRRTRSRRSPGRAEPSPAHSADRSCPDCGSGGPRDRAALRLRACRAARSSSRFSRFRRPCSRSRCSRGIASTLHALLSTSQPYFAACGGAEHRRARPPSRRAALRRPRPRVPREQLHAPAQPARRRARHGPRMDGWALLATILASLGMIGLAPVLAWRRVERAAPRPGGRGARRARDGGAGLVARGLRPAQLSLHGPAGSAVVGLRLRRARPRAGRCARRRPGARRLGPPPQPRVLDQADRNRRPGRGRPVDGARGGARARGPGHARPGSPGGCSFSTPWCSASCNSPRRAAPGSTSSSSPPGEGASATARRWSGWPGRAPPPASSQSRCGRP